MPDRSKQFFGLALLIVGLALCSYGLSQLLKPDQYAATTRIKLEGTTDITGLDTHQQPFLDRYYIQTTFEILQSQVVLFAVITNLNLNEVWGRKYFNGVTLKSSETMAMIKSRMNLALVHNTMLVAITFYSDDPNEAAQVANAIAEVYRNRCISWHREETKSSLESFQQGFQDEEKQISVIQTNVEQLRQKFGIQDIAPTNQSPEQQPYWDKKRELNQRIEMHKLLYLKIEAEKLELQIPKTSMVQITDVAEPPKSPVSPNRFLGGCLVAAGLLLMIFGWLLLKPSGQQTD